LLHVLTVIVALKHDAVVRTNLVQLEEIVPMMRKGPCCLGWAQSILRNLECGLRPNNGGTVSERNDWHDWYQVPLIVTVDLIHMSGEICVHEVCEVLVTTLTWMVGSSIVAVGRARRQGNECPT
jgi:hypothetical protein